MSRAVKGDANIDNMVDDVCRKLDGWIDWFFGVAMQTGVLRNLDKKRLEQARVTARKLRAPDKMIDTIDKWIATRKAQYSVEAKKEKQRLREQERKQGKRRKLSAADIQPPPH